jgi:hypothetical protein
MKIRFAAVAALVLFLWFATWVLSRAFIVVPVFPLLLIAPTLIIALIAFVYFSFWGRR